VTAKRVKRIGADSRANRALIRDKRRSVDRTDQLADGEDYPEMGFEEIEVRTALRIARISSNRTSGQQRQISLD